MRRYGGSTSTTPTTSTTAPAPADAPASMLAQAGSGTLHVSQADAESGARALAASPAAHAVPAPHGPGGSSGGASSTATARQPFMTCPTSTRCMVIRPVLPRPDRGHGRHDGRLRPLAARHLPARADRRHARRRHRHRHRQGGRRASLEPVPRAQAFAEEMGGTPRRGLLFEGLPGTGKTYLAKAMAAEAGVPFLFVSATSFQSMYYGATARKIRSYFKALRKAARQEGGAIGFIEEIDAIAMARGGLSMRRMSTGSARVDRRHVLRRPRGAPSSYANAAVASARRAPSSRSMTSEGVGGVVNELLVQMQSFDEPTGVAEVPDLVHRQAQPLPARRTASSRGRRRRRPTSWSSPRRTVPTTSTPRCCVRAASTVASPSRRPPRRGGATSSTTSSRRRPTTPSSTPRARATAWRR